MEAHTCKEAVYCTCSSTALEPSDGCPFHGFPYPKRCQMCGRFMSETKIMQADIERVTDANLS